MANLWSGKAQGEWWAMSKIRDKSYGDRIVPLVRLNCPSLHKPLGCKIPCPPIPQERSDVAFLALALWHERRKLPCPRRCHKPSKTPEVPPGSLPPENWKLHHRGGTRALPPNPSVSQPIVLHVLQPLCGFSHFWQIETNGQLFTGQQVVRFSHSYAFSLYFPLYMSLSDNFALSWCNPFTLFYKYRQ